MRVIVAFCAKVVDRVSTILWLLVGAKANRSSEEVSLWLHSDIITNSKQRFVGIGHERNLFVVLKYLLCSFTPLFHYCT